MLSREPALRFVNLYGDNISSCTIKETEENNETQITNNLVHSLISTLSSTVKSLKKVEEHFSMLNLHLRKFSGIDWVFRSLVISL